MHIGTLELGLTIHAAASLKDRRRTVTSLKQRVRNRFNAGVADLDDDPSPSYARIGIVCVANDPRRLDAQLRSIVEFVEALHLDLEVMHDHIDIIQL